MSQLGLLVWLMSISGVFGGLSSNVDGDFVVVWNIPIHKCLKFNISFDLDKYGIIHNSGGSFTGDKINIFYTFGKFPFIDESGVYQNGGLPQLGSSYEYDHRLQVLRDVEKTIPNPAFTGLAVLDWETWRPKWVTNWTPFAIYRQESINLVMSDHPQWTRDHVTAQAIDEFEFAARYFMQVALMSARLIRPQGLWGYYGFPECYNHDPLQKYCDAHISKSNDELQWMYNESSALYPSIYIGKTGKDTVENAVYVYGRLFETMRVRRNSSNPNVPIYPYSIVHYINSPDFLELSDLLITIGQVAALKFSGVVLWGRWANFNSREKCDKFENYFRSTLGPAIQHIRMVNALKLDPLDFPDTLPERDWMDQILQFYN